MKSELLSGDVGASSEFSALVLGNDREACAAVVTGDLETPVRLGSADSTESTQSFTEGDVSIGT